MNSFVKTSFLLLVTLGTLSSCWFPRRADLQSRPVIKVDSEALSLKEFAERLAIELRPFIALQVKNSALLEHKKEKILQDFLFQALVKKYSREQQVVISETEITAGLDLLRKGLPSDLSFREWLLSESLSVDRIKVDIEQRLLEAKLFEKIGFRVQTPTTEEIEAYFKTNPSDQFIDPDLYLTRQILVKERTLAEELIKSLRGQSFPELAKKFSISPDKDKDGLIGWVDIKTNPEFAALAKMRPGQTSEIIETHHGFHILRLERKQPGRRRPLEMVRNEIKNRILGERLQGEFMKWLDEQVRQTRVWRDHQLIKSVVVETQIDS